MTLLDTFFIQFTSNADAVDKANKSAAKSSKELEDGLAKNDRNTKELASSLTKVVEGLASAATAYVTFGALKAGILKATDFNADLQLTSKLTGQNAQDIAAFGATLEQFGGSSAGFEDTLKLITRAMAEQGMQLPPLLPLFKSLNREFQGLSLNESSRRAGLFGITDDATLQLLRQTPEAYDRIIAEQQKYHAVSKESGPIALAFNQALGNTAGVFNQIYTAMANFVLPALTKLINKFNEWSVHHVKGMAVAMAVLAAAIIAIGTAITGGAIVALAGFGAAAVAAIAPFLALSAAIAAAIAAVAALDNSKLSDHKTWLGKKIWHMLHDGDASDANSAPALGGDKGKSAMSFWMRQGYTPDQAAGIAANEMAESSGNPAARNVDSKGGMHYGLYQWSEARRKNILAKYGIDVANADANQQRIAAGMEMAERGEAQHILGSDGQGGVAGAGDTAAYMNSHFEVSGEDPTKRMMLAAQIASANANSSPLNGAGNSGKGDKNVNVQTGDITIHTQATDADGIAAALNENLQSHMSNAVSNWDDGVRM